MRTCIWIMVCLVSFLACCKLCHGNSGHHLALNAAAVNNSSDFPISTGNLNSGYCLFKKTGSGCLLCLLVAE